MVRPAPWQHEPKELAMLFSVPTSTHEAVPIEPGTNTGWPSDRYSGSNPSNPGPNARVAPLR